MTNNTTQCNPELAEEYIANIFALLYEAWPVRISLDAHQVTGIDFDTEMLYVTPRVPIPKEWEVCAELFNWLIDEEYIRTDGHLGSIWVLGRTQLTHKAIEALKKVPDPLNPGKRTMIDAIVDVAKDSGKQARNQLIKAAMTALYQTLNT